MRIIVMFDLPQVTQLNKKNYSKWHKFLIRTGFIMMTESVYSRLVINRSILSQVKKLIKFNLPPNGTVQILEVTEKQFCNIEYCLGEEESKVINNLERYIEI